LPFKQESLAIEERKISEKKQEGVEFSSPLVYIRNMAIKKKTGKTDRIASPQVSYGPSPYDVKPINRKVIREVPPIEEFEKEEETWENIVEMYSQVKDIDDDQGVVYLNCKYKKDSDETFERLFPLKHFRNNDKLKVDKSIIVKVLEKPGEVRFLFEEADEDFFNQDVEDISIDDPEYSSIFKPL
jgi:hypothetical protein